MGKYFKTDGIRGTYGDACINLRFAYRLGSAIGQYLVAKTSDSSLNVVIGRDPRLSGRELVQSLIQGLKMHRISVYDLGIVPTPCVAFSLVKQAADFGIVVTASHNPASDNGIKLFDCHGFKLNETEESIIEGFVDKEPAPPAELPVVVPLEFDGVTRYIDYVSSLLEPNCLCGWKVVLDLANGATCRTTPAVFDYWGAETILMGDQPDGENINRGFGSEYPEKLAQSVLEHEANLGIAHDGDGDRLVVCDETGTVVNGDVLLALFGTYAMKSGTLSTKTFVTTVQSNLGLDHAIRSVGGLVERTDVGDRHVAMRMRELGSNIGGENSGHVIFSDLATTGDGLLAALKVIDLMFNTNRKLSDLRQEIALFPQVTLNLPVVRKIPLSQLRRLSVTISKMEEEFGEEGRILVRYSGTESKLRLLVEGKKETQIAKVLKLLEEATRDDLEVIDER